MKTWDELPQYMMSIRPEWVKKELTKEKLLEVRRTAPRGFGLDGATVWVYETKNGGGRGAVVARFKCQQIYAIDCRGDAVTRGNWDAKSCLKAADLRAYQGSRGRLFFWEVLNIRELPVPLALRDFGLKCAPESWCKCRLPVLARREGL